MIRSEEINAVRFLHKMFPNKGTVIPKNKSQEITNRVINALEKENRIREEVKKSSTLSEVMFLKNWERQK